MKKFIIDQTIFLVFGIAIAVSIPSICGPFLTVFFEVVVILCWGYLCHRIILLPIDLIIGKVTHTACFATQSGIESLEFFKNTYCYEWKFNLKNGQSLRLLVPITISPTETCKLVPLQKGAIYKITYFSLSKILLEWHYEGQ